MKNRVWVIEMRHLAQKKWMVLVDAIYSSKSAAVANSIKNRQCANRIRAPNREPVAKPSHSTNTEALCLKFTAIRAFTILAIRP